MPPGDVDALEAGSPGFLQGTLDDWSEEIDDRLRKRYEVPFASPPPKIILRWLTRIVTKEAYDKRGRNYIAGQEDASAIDAPYLAALAEIKEAADSKDGLFELPFRSDRLTTGVTQAGPLAYSETSPYTGFDLQRKNAAVEDGNSGNGGGNGCF